MDARILRMVGPELRLNHSELPCRLTVRHRAARSSCTIVGPTGVIRVEREYADGLFEETESVLHLTRYRERRNRNAPPGGSVRRNPGARDRSAERDLLEWCYVSEALVEPEDVNAVIPI